MSVITLLLWARFGLLAALIALVVLLGWATLKGRA
jgi:Flp pilus assembly pilin Flp